MADLVRCALCEHFEPNISGDTNAIGWCFKRDELSQRPWQEHNCTDYESLTPFVVAGEYVQLCNLNGKNGAKINAEIGVRLSAKGSLALYTNRGGYLERAVRLRVLIDAAGLGLLDYIDWRKLARDAASHRRGLGASIDESRNKKAGETVQESPA